MTPLFIAIVAAAGVHLSGIHPLPTPTAPREGAPAEGGSTPSPAVLAAPSIPSEVMVLHATNNESGIDPRIGKMPALSKPPFSSYNSYKLLSRTSLPLPRGQAAPLSLPTGRVLRVTYRDALPPRKPGTPPRYLISASIQSRNGKAFLPNVEVNAKAHEWFWLGGQAYQGGSLFIGIKVNP
jgi:hypothetical protein